MEMCPAGVTRRHSFQSALNTPGRFEFRYAVSIEAVLNWFDMHPFATLIERTSVRVAARA